MAAFIDYPVSGPVCTTFPVGGTYDDSNLTRKPPLPPLPLLPPPVTPPYVNATLYDSNANMLDQQNCPASNGTWTGTLTDPNPPNQDCYVTAQLVINGVNVGAASQVNDLDTSDDNCD
jgi:hypothetical protein